MATAKATTGSATHIARDHQPAISNAVNRWVASAAAAGLTVAMTPAGRKAQASTSGRRAM